MQKFNITDAIAIFFLVVCLTLLVMLGLEDKNTAVIKVDKPKIVQVHPVSDLPTVENGILYTSLGNIPIKFITNIEIIRSLGKYVHISYRLDEFRCGMITMPYHEFKKIEHYFRKSI